MRALLQRVTSASVLIDHNPFSSIGKGLLVLIGIEEKDTIEDAKWLANKIAQLRIFSDENGLMNKNVNEINGSVLIVSQFTLFASYKKGNRPSFLSAANPEIAIPLYEYFILETKKLIVEKTETGSFGADMQIELTNDGPVTILMDSRDKE